MVIYGTRPEAVKLAPVVKGLSASSMFSPTVVVTGQHRHMLDQVHSVFGIAPDHDLDIHRAGQSLSQITACVLEGLTTVLRETSPSAVMVQGDTTSAMAAALAAFYAGIPLVHLEAGLRTGDPRSPFPEEVNRRIAAQLAELHLAPTQHNRLNLLREGVDPTSIYVTGNTVVDAIHWALDSGVGADEPLLRQLAASPNRVIVVTAHRRESWGAPLAAISRALAELAQRNRDITVVFPIHANPQVRAVVAPALEGLSNVILTGPLSYGGFIHLLRMAHVVVSDSGGIQEEAPSAGTPVLVLRSTTERVEGVTAGTARLIGTETSTIIAEVQRLLDDDLAHAQMAVATNPYGDGLAADRTVAALAHWAGRGPRPDDFVPGASDDEVPAWPGTYAAR